jgi:hypothetical protein
VLTAATGHGVFKCSVGDLVLPCQGLLGDADTISELFVGGPLKFVALCGLANLGVSVLDILDDCPSPKPLVLIVLGKYG